MLERCPGAFRVLRQWKSVAGSSPIPSHVIANLHLSRKEPDLALRELKAALVKAPADTVTLTHLGDTYLALNDPREAISQYRQALKANGENSIASNNLAWALAEHSNELAEALRLAQSATRLAPTYVDAFDTLGWVRYRRGEYAEAIAALTKARDLAPDRLDIASHLGLAHAKAGAKAKALPELRRALTARELPNRGEVERVVAELSR